MREQRNGTLTQAMALLIHNQAELVAQVSQVNKDRARTERKIEEIKSTLARHDVILRQMQETLQGLPEPIAEVLSAVRQKIGFKAR